MASISPARKALHFLVDYWFIPVLFVLAIVAYLTFKRWRPGEDPFTRIKEELGIIEAGTAARNMAVQVGTEQAIQHVKDKYQAKLTALDAEQQIQVKELEDDPVALARYLERLSR